MEQEKVWDELAEPWKKFRNKIFPEVEDFLKGKKGKILDLGCGSGRNFAAINGEIYGVDFSQRMLNLAKEDFPDAHLIKASADKLPFEDGFFDGALFVAVLHCIDSAKKREAAVKELSRVLKKNAQALILVWSKNQERVRNKPKEGKIPWTVNEKKHFRYYYIYSQEELKKLLEKVGFRIILIGEKENIVAVVEKG
jgi:ubiquinone/menaquinone biosynthesis C-methylase UbiE